MWSRKSLQSSRKGAFWGEKVGREKKSTKRNRKLWGDGNLGRSNEKSRRGVWGKRVLWDAQRKKRDERECRKL